MISPPESSNTSAGSRVMMSLTSFAITKVLPGVAAESGPDVSANASAAHRPSSDCLALVLIAAPLHRVEYAR